MGTSRAVFGGVAVLVLAMSACTSSQSSREAYDVSIASVSPDDAGASFATLATVNKDD